MSKSYYSEALLADVCKLRVEGNTWEQVAKKVSKAHKTELTAESVRHLHRRHSDSLEVGDDFERVKSLQKLSRARKTSALNARENRQILNYLNTKDTILEETEKLISGLNKKFPKPTSLKRSKARNDLTLEVMVSDLHIGKKTDSYNLEVAKRRVAELAYRVKQEISYHSGRFNVNRLIVAFLGDMIESATMHGVESARGVEFGNSRQVVECVNLLLTEFLVPLSQTGLPIDIYAVPGNHDRTESKRTYVNPGEECLSFIVYSMLDQFCKQLKLNNITFHISRGLHAVADIYGNKVIYEHADELKGLTRNSMESRLNSLQTQLGLFIHFYRGAHYHEFVMFGRGRFIINESLVGPDGYSIARGYASNPGQTINSYVNTNKRPNCFFRSYPVRLR